MREHLSVAIYAFSERDALAHLEEWVLTRLQGKSDSEVDVWIANHEKAGRTDDALYRELLEERRAGRARFFSPIGLSST